MMEYKRLWLFFFPFVLYSVGARSVWALSDYQEWKISLADRSSYFVWDSDQGQDFRESKLHYVEQMAQELSEFSYEDIFFKNLSWNGLFHPPLPLGALPKSVAIDRRYLGASDNLDNFGPSLQNKVDALTESELVSGIEIELVQDGQSFQKMRTLILNAERFLFVNMLAAGCKKDSDGHLFELLREKAKSGTQVWFVVDGLFSLLSASCFKELEQSGVAVFYLRNSWFSLRPLMHSSFLVNDKKELLIGSQNIYWGFLDSNGINNMDRDVSLYLKGAVATDAIHESLHLWGERPESSMSRSLVSKYLHWIQGEKMKEIGSRLRGNSNYQQWFSDSKFQDSCRFVAQRPKGEKRDLELTLIEHVRATQKQLSISSVKFVLSDDPKSVVGKFLKLFSDRNLEVEFFGNGVRGGNGELTMELNDWVQDLTRRQETLSWWENIKLKLLSRWSEESYKKQWSKNKASYRQILDHWDVKIWLHYNFTHHKTWEFDHSAYIFTSALFSDRTFNDFYFAGVICYRRGIMDRVRAFDLANSIPLTRSTFRK
ncbi:MAG: phosphatidylserine/phosphatidylglycerophosphate/cardiolipin synthase family protein [Bdellovibrionales bacterium]|nr:phosphatidylserine/phosphatidylglycerophosphate/cardiolipin synthase family protein [Bdellovibrionales bacterium]